MAQLPSLRAFYYKPEWRLFPVYTVILLLLFHNFVVAYLNSSYLEQFISPAGVGTIYTIGAAVSVLLFLLISRVLQRVGNFKLTIAILVVNFIAVTGLAFAESLRLAIPLFLVFLIAIPFLIFNLDVFLEEAIGSDETATGSRRGLLLTLGSLVGALSPLAGGLILDASNGAFMYAYLVSAGTLIPIILILYIFLRGFSDPDYDEIDLFSAIRTFWVRQSMRNVFLAHFILQVFFMMTVIYMPLYITSNIGLSWTGFGIIMFFGGMAYVLFEYPIGIIADKYIGEKEMMAVGFLILALTLSWMSFLTTVSLVIWSIVMFVMRIGASLVETTTESYFFKYTKSNDAQVISFFRVTRPLAYVIGTLFAGFCLLYLPFNLLFVMMALLMIPAMFLTSKIVDSK